MYADLNYYRNVYIGQSVVDDTKLTQYLTRASDDLDIACLGRIDITVMAAGELTWLQKAACAQAESYAQQGISEGEDESVSLGSFSYSGKSAPGGLSSRAARYLVFTGLMNRSVAATPVRNLQELDSGAVLPEFTRMVDAE